MRSLVETSMDNSLSCPGRNAACNGALQSRGLSRWVPVLRSSVLDDASHRQVHAAPRPGHEILPPLSRDLVERHVLVDADVTGQAEHALGDDVAQNFVGTAGDTHRRRIE